MDRNNDLQQKSLLTPCCLFRPKEKNYTVQDYVASEEIKVVKQQMLNGKRPTQCNSCWRAEDSGIKSLRQSVNQKRLAQYKDQINNNFGTHKFKQVKFDVGYECNLACRMCLPHLSSGVNKVWQALRRPDVRNSISVDTYDYIIENSATIEYIDIIGGEPFFHKKTKKLLSELISIGANQHISIFCVTNGTRLDMSTIELLKKFKDVVLSISLDGIGAVYEYIRPGSNWNVSEHNLQLLRKNGITFQISPTISVVSILGLEDLEEWCKENDYLMSQPNVVEQPLEMSPHNLPHQLHRYVSEKYQPIINSQNINADSLNFVRDLDLYWGTDIVNVMPVWKNVFEKLHWKNFNELKIIDQEMRQYVK